MHVTLDTGREERLADPAVTTLSEAALAPLPRRYAALGDSYAPQVATTPLPEPRLLHLNTALAQQIGLGGAADPEFTAIMAGNQPWPGYAPISSVYAGHQFGSFVPQLGDG